MAFFHFMPDILVMDGVCNRFMAAIVQQVWFTDALQQAKDLHIVKAACRSFYLAQQAGQAGILRHSHQDLDIFSLACAQKEERCPKSNGLVFQANENMSY